PLWDVDEARHAEVAREMATGHGWRRFFLPTFANEPYREKPPGFYWLVTASYELAGVSAGAARGGSAGAAWIVLLATYLYAAGRDGAAGGLGAAIVLLTSLGFAGFGRYANLDMVLTAFVTIGVLSGLAWLESSPPRRRLLAPYVAAALAV